jgi:hypothetical protein
MAEAFLQLSTSDQREALEFASGISGRPVHLLQKDVWVVWALETLYASAVGPHLVFKGGTSLSKAYGVIDRFSEDVDLTYDIRTLAPDLVVDGVDGLPPTRSQEKKWSKEIKIRLARWAEDVALPIIKSALKSANLQANARVEEDRIYIEYAPFASGTGYVRPAVMLEFGARSTGEPWETRAVICDAATALPQLVFPTATPRVMRIERTFWEKATAIHVFCLQGRFRGAERFARHWHDIARLGQTNYLQSAISDQVVAQDVARHKAIFFPEKDSNGDVINYDVAISGGLRLVPDGAALDLLAEDYRKMVEDGLLLTDADPFDMLIEKCWEVEQEARSAKPAEVGIQA